MFSRCTHIAFEDGTCFVWSQCVLRTWSTTQHWGRRWLAELHQWFSPFPAIQRFDCIGQRGRGPKRPGLFLSGSCWMKDQLLYLIWYPALIVYMGARCFQIWLKKQFWVKHLEHFCRSKKVMWFNPFFGRDSKSSSAPYPVYCFSAKNFFRKRIQHPRDLPHCVTVFFVCPDSTFWRINVLVCVIWYVISLPQSRVKKVCNIHGRNPKKTLDV